MKKFVLKSLLLGGVLLALLYAVDVSISSLLKTSNGPAGEYQVWNDIYNSNIDADLAIYGSSRAWVHIDPEILQDSLGVSAYNFGINGHSFWLQYFRHLEYLKHNETPSTILLSVDVFSLAKRKDLYAYEQFLPYMLWNSEMKSYTESYTGFDKLEYSFPFVRYKNEFEFIKKMYRKKRRGPIRNLGYKGNERVWDTLLEKERAKNKSFESQINAASVALFHQFVKECQENDIDLIFVYAPEHVTGQKFVKNRSEIIGMFEETAKENNIPFLDYSKDSLNYNRAYFYNASHLNKSGAELFTRQLAQDIAPLLSSHQQN